MRQGNNYILCIVQKNWLKQSIIIWSIPFKNEPNRLRLTLTDKLNLKDPNKIMALANLSIYYMWKNIKSEYNNNKCKSFGPIWNDEIVLPDGSYSVWDI